jgi:hypothetical protein
MPLITIEITEAQAALMLECLDTVDNDQRDETWQDLREELNFRLSVEREHTEHERARIQSGLDEVGLRLDELAEKESAEQA